MQLIEFPEISICTLVESHYYEPHDRHMGRRTHSVNLEPSFGSSQSTQYAQQLETTK